MNGPPDRQISPLAERLLNERGILLGTLGFAADPGSVQRHGPGSVVLFHYTRPEKVDRILSKEGGLWARLPVVNDDSQPEFDNHHLVEAFLEPLPKWTTDSPYFGNLGLEMMKAYVGNLLLRVELPEDYPGLYVADYAHTLELKHIERRGQAVLNLGYDSRTGHHACRADVNSYIHLPEYRGGHLAPNAKIVRHGEGIAVPSKYITVNPYQPLSSSDA